jgi:glyoxylase-like metal-dependent hydrolase (beta-lactamase superfamily II)
VETDVGVWRVLETPGHAPSHVVLHQPERRLLISGDLVLGRVALYFDYGYTADPVGEFLASLDRVDALDVRLTLAGHAKPFTDLRGHVASNRRLVAERLAGVHDALAGGEDTAYAIARRLYGPAWSPESASWLLTKTLCYLTYLERRGEVARRSGEDGAEQWAAAA